MNIKLETGSDLLRGERYIIVDGEQWGRTSLVRGGQKPLYAIVQKHGARITERGRHGYNAITSSSDMLVQTICKLIDGGLLVHPDKARA